MNKRKQKRGGRAVQRARKWAGDLAGTMVPAEWVAVAGRLWVAPLTETVERLSAERAGLEAEIVRLRAEVGGKKRRGDALASEAALWRGRAGESGGKVGAALDTVRAALESLPEGASAREVRRAIGAAIETARRGK